MLEREIDNKRQPETWLNLGDEIKMIRGGGFALIPSRAVNLRFENSVSVTRWVDLASWLVAVECLRTRAVRRVLGTPATVNLVASLSSRRSLANHNSIFSSVRLPPLWPPALWRGGKT